MSKYPSKGGGRRRGSIPGTENSPSKAQGRLEKSKFSLAEENDSKSLSYMHAEGFGLHPLRGNGKPLRGLSKAINEWLHSSVENGLARVHKRGREAHQGTPVVSSDRGQS